MGTPALITTTFSDIKIYCHYDGNPKWILEDLKSLTKKWKSGEFVKRTPDDDPEYFMAQLISCVINGHMSKDGTCVGITSDEVNYGVSYNYTIKENCDVYVGSLLIYNIITGEGGDEF